MRRFDPSCPLWQAACVTRARGKGAQGMDGHDGLIADLEAQLQAAWERADDDAASDLASSLRNGADLIERLTRQSTRAVTSLGEHSVDVVARDHVITGDGCAVPLFYAIFEECAGSLPAVSELTFVQRLRTWARQTAYVTLDTAHGTRSGVVRSVGTDHLVLVSTNVVLNVPLELVRAARRLTGSSTGVL